MPRKTPEPEQPQAGGSYLRQDDGSLLRVEGPELPVEPAPAEDAGAQVETATGEAAADANTQEA